MNLTKNLKKLMRDRINFIKNNLSKRDRIWFIGILVVIIIILAGLLISDTNKKEVKDIKEYKSETPVLELSIKYFDKNLISYGSYASTDSEGNIIWKSANIDDGYRSFPTTEITLDGGYSNEISDLPLGVDIEEINNWETDDDAEIVFRDLVNDNVKEYGPLATRFFPEQYITDLREFDVDNDGQVEKIVSLCGVWGNHCPHEILIIKGDKIIFSAYVGLVGLGLENTNTKNGFYLKWVPSSKAGSIWDTGLCCSPGYMKTRFVFEKGKFKPVYEQKILYVEVRDPAYK